MAISPSALGSVMEVFERNFREHGEIGASVSIWYQGSEILSLSNGWRETEKIHPWTSQTIVPVYSATKVPAATTLLCALAEKGLSAATPVQEVWPRFPIPQATFAHLLSHQCGLPVLDRRAHLLDHPSVVEAIEIQSPAWPLGNGHGYHPRTFGSLVDEPVRRLSGLTLGGYWREMIANPLHLDFWIGLPETEWHRMAKLYPGKSDPSDLSDPFYQQLSANGSFTRRAFFSPRGLHSVHEMNDSRSWATCLPALGGIGTASALAQFYQALIGTIPSPIPPSVRNALASLQSSGDDRVLLRPTAFTCGAQLDPVNSSGNKIRSTFGPSLSAFGHPGAGGSHAFADPEHQLSFAYIMNQMDLSVMPGKKCLDLVQALYSDAL